jgi:hypothetical protein
MTCIGLAQGSQTHTFNPESKPESKDILNTDSGVMNNWGSEWPQTHSYALADLHLLVHSGYSYGPGVLQQ